MEGQRGKKEPKVGTLGDLIARRHELTLHCEAIRPDGQACGHSAPLPVPALAERYGIDRSLQWLMMHCHCSACGARWPKIDCRISPSYVPKAY